MSTPNYIINQPLPLSKDFRTLKREGLAYIQQCSGAEWTNLNPSDPGVTILDQLCYALTELGYCNDFPVKDILTDQHGKLQLKDQFYLPQDILTTAPVTADDYRKYLIDGVDYVNNVMLYQLVTAQAMIYQPYLLIDETLSVEEGITVCNEAFFYLNKRRNLGTIFMPPLPFQTVSYTLSGQINLAGGTDFRKIPTLLQRAIDAYVFPKVAAAGYQQLVNKGLAADEIFNGPLLQNGWIPSADLGEIKQQLSLTELNGIITSIPGITGVSKLAFIGSDKTTISETTPGSLLFIDINASLQVNGGLVINSANAGNQKLPAVSSSKNAIAKLPKAEANILFGAALDIQTDLPQGRFRDINTYYSIQNTFPEIFAVGADTMVEHTSSFKVAQSRQLKGYLSLFDQVLANQFSQLANIGTLFSFKNAMSGTPSDEASYYAQQDQFEKEHQQYPVPYQVFSPTYFYQSLYDVPHIRPLLKDNNTFRFGIQEESKKELAYKSWIEYQRDPYNAYIHGLMECMEDESISLERRNNMLNHLLSRHGESPLLLDAITGETVYSGERLRDKVIVKSLYLQNLDKLSYFRQKAFNYIGAAKISPPETLVESQEHTIPSGDFNDFIFDTEKSDRRESLSELDFNNYSAIELEISLLFGLKTLYKEYIAAYMVDEQEQTKLAGWMIRERRGMICIETALLNNGTTHVSTLNTYTENKLVFLFPDFLPALNNDVFRSRLDLFLQNNLPVTLPYQCCFVNEQQLSSLIPAFVAWHNDLIYINAKQLQADTLEQHAIELNQLLGTIKTSCNNE